MESQMQLFLLLQQQQQAQAMLEMFLKSRPQATMSSMLPFFASPPPLPHVSAPSPYPSLPPPAPLSSSHQDRMIEEKRRAEREYYHLRRQEESPPPRAPARPEENYHHHHKKEMKEEEEEKEDKKLQQQQHGLRKDLPMCGTLFMCKLSSYDKEKDLKRYFEQFGQVEGVKIIMDPMTGTSKCYGFVFFYEIRSAHAALSQRDHFFGNPPRPFIVKQCTLEDHEDCTYADRRGKKRRYYKFNIASKSKKRMREDEDEEDGYLPLDSYGDDENKHQRKKQRRGDRFSAEDSSETRSASATPRR